MKYPLTKLMLEVGALFVILQSLDDPHRVPYRIMPYETIQKFSPNANSAYTVH